MHSRRVAVAAAAGVTALAVAAGCTADPEANGNPGATPTSESPSPTASPTEPTLRVEDVSVGGGTQANREGMLLCGDRLVAAPPTAGIENNAFAVFDETSGEGEITHVELPADSHLEVNARWLLVMDCIDNPDIAPNGPILSFAYQEMPLPETDGVGVRGAYTLEGQLLWMRNDINLPSELVDGLLVLGAAPDQPELVVDAVTGKTLREFSSPTDARIVLNHNRMVVRTAGESPTLTNISGKPIATLRSSGNYVADGNLIFGVNFRDVAALRPRDGKEIWSYPIQLDPLGHPRVDEQAGVVVFVDDEYVAHAVDARTGKKLWEFPTEVENPRVTVAAGIVLLDKRDDGYQVLLDARTGAQLPEREETVIDLKPAGALEFQDGVATIVPPHELRNPPPSPTDDDTDETEDTEEPEPTDGDGTVGTE